MILNENAAPKIKVASWDWPTVYYNNNQPMKLNDMDQSMGSFTCQERGHYGMQTMLILGNRYLLVVFLPFLE